MDYQVEVTRNNVTLAQFLAACRFECKKKGICFEIERDEFEKPPYPCNTYYFIKDGKKISFNEGCRAEWNADDAPCKSEICKTKPLDTQTYILNHDGSMYNEICEFTFWDDKKGTGYYYRANRD